MLAETDACDRAIATAADLRDAINTAYAEEGVGWACYGTY